jgi:GntR family transcriptional regulator/MocR family aminotransferase
MNSPLKDPFLVFSKAPLFEVPITLAPKGSRTQSRSLYVQLKDAIISGRLQPGLSLPSTRTFAASLGVSRNTVVAAYQSLISDGYLYSRQGSGTYVARVTPLTTTRRAGPDDVARRYLSNPLLRDAAASLGRTFPATSQDLQYNFRVGLPDMSHFPFERWRLLATRALRAFAREPSTRVDHQGRQVLREAISKHVSYVRALGCEPNDIIVTTGAQQAFDLLARTLVTSGRTTVALEEPGYPMLRAAFIAAGARIAPVRVDKEGLIVDRLPKDAKVICVTPSHQFPLGVVMSLKRRTELLEFARLHGAVVIEDDYDGEFRVGGHPVDNLKTLDHAGRVFFVGTFSKCLFPSVRVGFILTPSWAMKQLVTAKQISDFLSSVHTQDTLALFISEGHLAKHIRKMRKIYAERRQVLYDTIQSAYRDFLTPIRAPGGLHLTAFAKSVKVEAAVIHAAAQLQIQLQPLSRLYVGRSPRPGLVFGYGAIDKQAIAKSLLLLSHTLNH